MTIALRTRPAARVSWSRPETDLVVAQHHGEYAGLVERRGARFIATDGLGAVVGTFDSERTARAALEPDAVERRHTARVARDRVLAGIAGVAATGSTVVAVVGMLSVLA